MGKKTLKFEKIEVKKMPGLENGLTPYEKLSPYINIIAGPNASGKSCTARAIQQLLWQNGDERLTASGEFSIENESWLSQVESSNTLFQKDASPADLKGIPSREEKSRYMLSLHELIRKDEKDLAESILKDAIGGYDIDEAKNNLGYSDSKRTTNNNQFREYKEATKSLVDITVQQKKLKGEQERLEDLEKEKENVTKAKDRADFYKLVLNFKEKQENLRSLKKQLSEFPEKMERVKEDDYTDFENLLLQIHEKGKELENIEDLFKELNEKKYSLKLPESGIDSLDTSKAEEYLEQLDKFESDIQKAEAEIKKAETDLNQASKRLGLGTNETDYDGLNAEAITTTEQFWQNGFKVFGEIRQLDQQIEKLEEQQRDAKQSDVLTSGISELSKWLRTYGSPAKPLSKLYLGILLIATLITAAAVQFFGPYGYLGTFIVAIILYLIYRDQNNGSDSAVSLREADYEKTGLTPPISWKAEQVSQRLGELIKELEEAKRQENFTKQLSDKKDQLKESRKKLEKFEEEANKLKDAISVLPVLNDETLSDYSSLYWHLNNVLVWEIARNRISAEESVIKKAKSEIDKWLEKLNPIFEKYGLINVTTSADAKANYKRLQELRAEFNVLSGKIEKAESDQERALEDKVNAEEKLQKICKRLEVTSEDSHQVKELVENLNDFKILKQQVSTAEGLLDDVQKTMKNDGLYEYEKEEIPEISIDDVKSRIEWNEQKAENLNDIREQITAIETRVKDAKQKHDLEHALQREEEALLDLEELYKQNAGSIIGDLLVKHLKGDLGEKNMPKVFERAKSLFKRITKERYELVVDSVNDKAVFRAKDLYDGVGRSLEELSSGTRIQLIMSVRLAFIEKAENDIKLPILADELLANSDSQRAGAIIDALIEISRDGRQIFYFTAQEDEVYKWKRKLKESKITNYKVYIIGGNGEKLPPEGEIFKGIQLHKEIPDPKSMSYDEYGTALEVSVLSNVFTPVEQLHTWYFLDDPELLYKVMKTGIENWGMLKSYFKEEGVIEGLDEHARDKIDQRADIIERYLEVLRHGQSKPIDRQVLEDSDAISDSFMNEVYDKLKEVGFDSEKLLTSLQNREVSGFRNNKIEELEEYLISNGYIQQNEPYSGGEIKTNMLAFISKIDISPKEAQIILDRLKQN